MSTVMISGANRGLGLEFARQYLEEGWRVLALCRDVEKASQLAPLSTDRGKLEIHQADVTDFDRVRELSVELADQAIDVLINNAGVFGPKPDAEGDMRQSFGSLDPEILSNVYNVNAVAPLIIAEAFLEQVLASEQKKVITLSSTMGSITETEGGLYAYRMSKAAVNMAMASLVKEIGSRGAIVTILNPGWVRTEMGGADADIAPEDSVSSMRTIIAGLGTAQSGSYINQDGRIIPW